MQIQACPRCASLRMHAPTMADGGVLGYSTMVSHVCPDCGFQGSALLLRDQAAYDELRAATQGWTTPDQADDLTAEEEEFLKDLDEGPTKPPGSKVSAVLIAACGVGLMGTTALVLLNAVEGRSPLLLALAFALGGVLEFFEAWAVLRIARRLWHGPRPA